MKYFAFQYPQLPPNLHWGEMKNTATSKCLDGMGRQPPSLIGIQHCHGYGNNQLIRLNASGQLGIGERCVEADSQGIKLAFCRMGTVDGAWKYDESTSLIEHRTHKKCIAVHPQSNQLSLMPCDENNAYQQWQFKTLTPRY